MMEQPYKPVACGFHDRLLDWATRHKPVRAQLVLDGNEVEVEGVIADVWTKGGAEFLRFAGGETYRLDALRSVDGWPVDGGACAL